MDSYLHNCRAQSADPPKFRHSLWPHLIAYHRLRPHPIAKPCLEPHLAMLPVELHCQETQSATPADQMWLQSPTSCPAWLQSPASNQTPPGKPASSPIWSQSPTSRSVWPWSPTAATTWPQNTGSSLIQLETWTENPTRWPRQNWR